MGGVELLYPILEQVHLPIRKKTNEKTAAVRAPNEDESAVPSPPPVKESPSAALDVTWWFDGEYICRKGTLVIRVRKLCESVKIGLSTNICVINAREL